MEKFTEKFDELLKREVVATADLESDTGKALVALAEEECKFSKTYTIKSTCKGKYLYLIRNAEKKIAELCITDLTDPD